MTGDRVDNGNPIYGTKCTKPHVNPRTKLAVTSYPENTNITVTHPVDWEARVWAVAVWRTQLGRG